MGLYFSSSPSNGGKSENWSLMRKESQIAEVSLAFCGTTISTTYGIMLQGFVNALNGEGMSNGRC